MVRWCFNPRLRGGGDRHGTGGENPFARFGKERVIRPLVQQLPFDREHVILPLALYVNQRPLPPAENEVLDAGEGQEFVGDVFGFHTLCATIMFGGARDMKSTLQRDQLHKQIDILPDDLVEQIADFALFLLAKRKAAPNYEDWNEQQWQNFSLEQFFREEDDVNYAIADAKEVYRP